MNREEELKTVTREMLFSIKTKGSYPDKYDKIIKEAYDIFIERNKLYGDAFNAIGLIGNIAVLIGDVFRLRTMCYKSDDYGKANKQVIRDKLLDIINQAALSIITLDKDNYTGE
jgi:hypothetical protein